jgi:serine/threonine protein kinase
VTGPGNNACIDLQSLLGQSCDWAVQPLCVVICVLNPIQDVMLGDFGLATVRNPDSEEEDHTPVGTPHYMSPELLSSKRYDHRTDIWYAG